MVANSSNESSRYLVIGCGSIGRRHIRNLIAIGVSEILAFDVQSDRRSEVESHFGVEAVDDLDDAWARSPGVVMITAPTRLHVSLAIESSRHNCHLFIEKPLSHSQYTVDTLCAEVDQRNLITMVGCNMRFHPGPVQIKKLLNEAAIGEVLCGRLRTGSYLPRWRPWQDYRQSYSASSEWGGAILDCIHEIDLALWLLGEAKLRAAVSCPAKSLGLQTDGLAELVLEHKFGAISSVHLNFVQRNYRRGIQIVGSEGTIEWDFNGDNGCVKTYGPNGRVKECIYQPPGWLMNHMYLDELSYFTKCVQAAEPTFNPVELAAQTLQIALQARASG